MHCTTNTHSMQVSDKVDIVINIFVWPNVIEVAACNGGWQCFGLGGCCFVYVGHFIQDKLGPSKSSGQMKEMGSGGDSRQFRCTIPH